MPFPYLFRKLFQNDGAGELLNKEIIPQLTADDVSDVLKTTVQSLSVDEKAQIVKNLAGTFLPLSGGVLTGDLNLNGNYALSGNVGMQLHSNYCDFMQFADGAVAKGSTFRFSDWPKGWWQGVRSVNGVGAGINGNITLGAGIYVTASYSKTGSLWARKWSNGLIEQAGVCQDNATVTFTYPFADSTSWFAVCTPLAEANYGIAVVNDSRTSTSCRFYLGHANYYGFYYVTGY